MLGSMFVGLLVGFLAGTLTNRGERMGCFGKMFLGWIGAFIGNLLFGTWGPIIAGTAITKMNTNIPIHTLILRMIYSSSIF